MTDQKPSSGEFLNRFTTLPVLLDILSNRRLTLLDPTTWEDRNDAYFMERYRCEKQLNTLLALCFSTKRETFHHWKVFSSGISGVCIEFDKDRLIKNMPKAGMIMRPVAYKNIQDLRLRTPPVDDWPFIKRSPYSDEGEYRIVFAGKRVRYNSKPIDVSLRSINRITLSPWLPKPLSCSVVEIIRSIDGCGKLKVYRSTLIENERWKATITPDLEE